MSGLVAHTLVGTTLAWLASAALAEDPQPGFVIVTSADRAPEPVTINQAKRLFSGHTTSWSDGQPITVVLPPKESKAMNWLTTQVVRTPEAPYRRYLLERAYRGDVPRPVTTDATTDVLPALRKTHGAIGILPVGEVPEDLKRVVVTQ